jgi:hypothetical protein
LVVHQELKPYLIFRIHRAFECKFKPAYKHEQLMNQFFYLNYFHETPFTAESSKKIQEDPSYLYRGPGGAELPKATGVRVSCVCWPTNKPNWNWMKAIVVSWDWKIGVNMIMNCFFSFLSPTATITEGDYLAIQDKTNRYYVHANACWSTPANLIWWWCRCRCRAILL